MSQVKWLRHMHRVISSSMRGLRLSAMKMAWSGRAIFEAARADQARIGADVAEPEAAGIE
jgi:hypothetical protein